jgi:CheY-like chemotaxis protein
MKTAVKPPCHGQRGELRQRYRKNGEDQSGALGQVGELRPCLTGFYVPLRPKPQDEPAIMKMGKRMLEKLGYQVLAANKPIEAIHIAEEFTGKIHLLITDVIMPEMNGRELAQQLKALYPDIKIVFMSGYTSNVIAHHGVLDDGVNFIEKPLSKKDLAFKIKEALDDSKDH